MTVRLYHGGAPGRRPGELLLPPSVTGLNATLRDQSRAQGLRNITQRHDRVYVTSHRELARAFAGGWKDSVGRIGRGSLYRVEAEECDPDPDLPGLGISFQTPQAVVTGVIDAHVPRNDLKYARVFESILEQLS
ncbi:hypothetical protein ACXR8F_21335 [Terrabacter sp. AAH1]